MVLKVWGPTEVVTNTDLNGNFAEIASVFDVAVSGDVASTTKSKKVEVFDSDGNSLGFLQIYSG